MFHAYVDNFGGRCQVLWYDPPSISIECHNHRYYLCRCCSSQRSIGLNCSCLLLRDMTGTVSPLWLEMVPLSSASLILVASAICLSRGSLKEETIPKLKTSLNSPSMEPLCASLIWSHMKEDGLSGSTGPCGVLEALMQSFRRWPALTASVLLDSPIY